MPFLPLLSMIAETAPVDDGTLLSRLLVALAVNGIIAAASFLLKAVSRSGAIGGFVVGTVIYTAVDWPGYSILVAFFVLGSIVTRWGYREKAARGIAEAGGGRRGVSNTLAKGGVGLVCAVLYLVTGHDVLLVAYVAAFATAVSDTVGSELGQLYGRTPILITTFRRVPPGTEGAVSFEGTILGVIASVLLGALAAALGVISWWGCLWVVVGAFFGTTFESYLGATIEGAKGLGKSSINFILTLAGAAAAGLLSLLTGLP